MPDYAHGYNRLSDEDMVKKMRKGWDCDETPCGTGSTWENSRYIRTLLPDLVEE